MQVNAKESTEESKSCRSKVSLAYLTEVSTWAQASSRDPKSDRLVAMLPIRTVCVREPDAPSHPSFRSRVTTSLNNAAGVAGIFEQSNP